MARPLSGRRRPSRSRPAPAIPAWSLSGRAQTRFTNGPALDAVAAEVIVKAGVEPLFLHYHPSWAPSPYPGVACISVNDAVVHSIPGRYRLAPGDLVSVDCGARLEAGLAVATDTTVWLIWHAREPPPPLAEAAPSAPEGRRRQRERLNPPPRRPAAPADLVRGWSPACRGPEVRPRRRSPPPPASPSARVHDHASAKISVAHCQLIHRWPLPLKRRSTAALSHEQVWSDGRMTVGWRPGNCSGSDGRRDRVGAGRPSPQGLVESAPLWPGGYSRSRAWVPAMAGSAAADDADERACDQGVARLAAVPEPG